MSHVDYEARLAQMLPDDYSATKDWRDSSLIARVDVLKELHQAALADRDFGWDAATAATELVMQLRAELRRVNGLNALDAERLQAENEELRRQLSTAQAHASSLRSVVGVAEALLDDPAYERGGTDFNYGHTVLGKIGKLHDVLNQSHERELLLTAEVSELRGRLACVAA